MKKLLTFTCATVLIFLSSTTSYGGGCWNLNEIADFEIAEVEGKLLLSFKDAVTCEPIVGAEVSLGSGKIKRTTDSKGRVYFPMKPFTELMDARIPIVVKKSGYIPLKTEIRVMVGSVWDKRFLMTKQIPANSARFVLSWDERPRDEDLHLIGPGFHVSYRNMKSVENQAKLDRDDTDGYGPETITLDRIESGRTYTVYVHNYSGEQGFTGKERVYVYVNNRLDKVIELPRTNKRVIKVLKIVDRQVRYINTPCNRIGE
ncbi:MAG: hypothetical protein ABGX27_01110 [Desulfurobacteriaceae bacterium]